MADDMLVVRAADVVRAIGGNWLRRHRRLMQLLGSGVIVACLLYLSGDREHGKTVLADIGFYGAIAIGMLTMSGLVSNDYRSGVVALWFQKPGPLVRTYLTHYAVLELIVVVAVTALSVVLSGVGIWSGALAPLDALRFCCGAIATALVSSALVFALSAWNVKRDSTVGLIVIFASVTLTAAFAFDSTGLAELVRAVSFPMDPIGAIAGGPAYDPNLIRPVSIVLVQFAVWTAIGVVGLKVTSRNLAGSGQAME